MVHGIDSTGIQACRDDLDTEIAYDCHKRRILFASNTTDIPAPGSRPGHAMIRDPWDLADLWVPARASLGWDDNFVL